MSKAPPLLQIKNLRRLMIGPLSLDVDSGDCLCISGPSGSGKSQLLRAIADLDPHEGESFLEGVASNELAANEWRARVGLLPPESCWWLPRAIDHFRDGVPIPLDHIGLTSAILEQPVSRLSSGEKQRLALMRLLSNLPRVLLLDEPTANLDPENTRRVEAVIAEYRRSHDAAVVWVSHDGDQVRRVANQHYVIAEGSLQQREIEGSQWLR